MSDSGKWQAICQSKKERRDEAIPQAWKLGFYDQSKDRNVIQVPISCGILSLEEIRITSDYDAVSLAEELVKGTYTAEAVTVAFCKRAAIAHQLTNCLTEIFFGEAIREAKALDTERLKYPNKPLRPFHGLPISLKDSFYVRGQDATIGLACFANDPAQQDAPLVSLLRDLGAIVYCKTNIPQTLQTCDTENNVFGRTANPHRLSFTVAGSTGGEAALIALRGSILGVGTDMAGSIRMPSAVCGIYGIRPSAFIVPFAGQRNPVPDGMVGMEPTAGPMATTLRSCQFFLRTIMAADPTAYDFTAVGLPWTGKDFMPPGHTLRIGYVVDDGAFTPSPPVRRGLRESMEKLERAGHTIIPVVLPDVAKALDLAYTMFGIDGGQYLLKLIESTGEPMVPSVLKMGIVLNSDGSRRSPITIEDLMRANVSRFLIAARYAELWRQHRLDVILMPPAPHTAIPADTWTALSYTVLWNVLDYPACIIPVGKVGPGDSKDQGARHGAADEAVYKLYSGSEEYSDLPIAVQLVGRRHHDEEFTAHSMLIDSIIRA
ncbi:General amidase-B [Neofusicoccum parvum]|uniref:General amidase-B n=1 Tax=Neofusicoccum parvum TaxID=310453 RepID=A0ACB5SK16_9PEZI|nr:General amidase-B [Neofusicoccum parvum]